MKQVILGLVLSFASISAFAQPIDLQPGGSIYINGDLISCMNPEPVPALPACSIKKDGSYYQLYTGTTLVETYFHFNDAISGATKLRSASLCR